MSSDNEIKLDKTNLPHVFLCDVDDSGQLKEILVVKKFEDGTIAYVDLGSLLNINKGRIKKIVSSSAATRYECWELLRMAKLSNGLNALEFFHSNFVKLKRPRGATTGISTLASVQAYGTDKMIGSDFVNPAEAQLDKNTNMFNV